MLNKTHIAVNVFFMLLFLVHVVHKTTYVVVFLIATFLPNLDAFLSGHTSWAMKPFRIFFKKRGFMHSFTFCLAITVLLAWFWPAAAFPFFLAYGLHLLFDSWGTEGIMPFWPLRKITKGKIETGGGFENILFYVFVAVDLVTAYIIFT